MHSYCTHITLLCCERASVILRISKMEKCVIKEAGGEVTEFVFLYRYKLDSESLDDGLFFFQK